MADYLILNGAAYSHANSEVRILDKVRQFVSEIEYEHEDEPGEIRGTHKQRLATVDGEYKGSGKITMARGQAQQIIDELGDGYMEKRFPIVCSYTGEGLKLITDTLGGCKIKKESFSSKTGNEGQMVTWELDITYLKMNGKKPLKKLIEG